MNRRWWMTRSKPNKLTKRDLALLERGRQLMGRDVKPAYLLGILFAKFSELDIELAEDIMTLLEDETRRLGQEH